MGVAPECLVESKTQAGTKELLRLLSSFVCLFQSMTRAGTKTLLRLLSSFACLFQSMTQAGTKTLLQLLSSFACLFLALPMGVTHVHNRTVFRVVGFAFVIVHVPATRKRKVVGCAASAPYGSSPRVLGGVEVSSKD